MLGHCVCVGSFAILIKFLKSVGVLKYVSPVFVFLEIVKKKKNNLFWHMDKEYPGPRYATK